MHGLVELVGSRRRLTAGRASERRPPAELLPCPARLAVTFPDRSPATMSSMDVESARPTGGDDRGVKAELIRMAGYLSRGIWWGALVGFVVGGLGGRLAMFVLRLTSGPEVIGLRSDDGFEMGRFSSDSGFLILLGTAVGAAIGLCYLIIRGWLPAALRPLAYGTLWGAVGGSAIVHPDGIDFRVLEPRWLAIAMFVVIPAAYGAAIAYLLERSIARFESADVTGRPVWLALAPLGGLIILGPLGAIVAVGATLVWLAARRLPGGLRWFRAAPMIWAGRAGLVGIAVWAVTALVRDALQILS